MPLKDWIKRHTHHNSQSRHSDAIRSALDLGENVIGMVGAIGFEPTTYGTQNRRATRLRYAPTDAVITRPEPI